MVHLQAAADKQSGDDAASTELAAEEKHVESLMDQSAQADASKSERDESAAAGKAEHSVR